jgi:hypothetical protein
MLAAFSAMPAAFLATPAEHLACWQKLIGTLVKNRHFAKNGTCELIFF